MSSANAPYPSFSGITYNKSFFASSSGGLTTAQGNAIYLQKTMDILIVPYIITRNHFFYRLRGTYPK